MSDLRIGLVGLDTSHALTFARLLNDRSDPHHVPGARVVAGYPGGSPDLPVSIDRVGNITAELHAKWGVKILEHPEDVAAAVDLVFITAVDGRVHRQLFDRTAQQGKPTFIDKPFATTVQDAQAILRSAREYRVPVMSSSPWRYATQLTTALSDAGLGAVVGIDVFGVMGLEPPTPGLFFYGVHCVEMLVTTLGTGCQRVNALSNAAFDVFIAEWSDGRMATVRGSRHGHQRFGATIHYEKGFRQIDFEKDGRPRHAVLLEAVLRSLPQRRSDVPEEQMLEVVRVLEAVSRSRIEHTAVDLQRQ